MPLRFFVKTCALALAMLALHGRLSASVSATLFGDRAAVCRIPDKYDPTIDPADRLVKPSGSGLVMSIPGHHGVSGSGAATYTIPLQLAPGTAGLVPSLSLSYSSSGGGNSYTGTGWQLGGISTIYRVRKDFYHDGKVEGVRMDQSDPLEMDGQRLVPTSGSPGTLGAEYRTEAESFSRVTVASVSDNGPFGFTVETADGMRLEYGGDASACLLNPDTKTVLAWYLRKMTDRSGNYILYEYASEDNEILPKRISYTGTKTFLPYNAVTFSYTPRYKSDVVYTNGLRVVRRSKLSDIAVLSEGGVVRSYHISYAYSDDYATLKMNSISLREGGTVLSATTVLRGEQPAPAARWQAIAPLSPVGYTDISTESGDFDGDGRMDIAVYPERSKPLAADSWRIYLGREGAAGDPLALAYSSQLGRGFVELVAADVDGDGVEEIVAHSRDSLSGKLVRENATPYKLVSGALVELPGYAMHLATDKPYTLEVGDFDGDRKQNLVFFSGCDIKGAGGSDLPLAAGAKLTKSGVHLTLDYDGDGIDEIMVRTTRGGRGGYFKYSPLSKQFVEISVNASIFGTFDNELCFGDFNGDGYNDILQYVGTSAEKAVSLEWNLFLFDGVRYQKSTLTNPFSEVGPQFLFVTGDFNGDGRTEVLFEDHDAGASFAAYSLCEGEFVKSQEFGMETFGDIDSEAYKSVGDYQGDGSRSLLVSYPGNTLRLLTFGNARQNAVKKIRQGEQAAVEFTYGTLAKGAGVYTSSESLAYPVVSNVGPWPVVSSVRFTSGILQSEVKYAYANARCHAKGRGFLGFGKVVAEDVANSTTTESVYGYSSSFYIPYLESQRQLVGGQEVLRTTYATKVKDLGAGRFFSYVEQATTQNTLAGTTSTVDYGYDANNNLTSRVSRVAGGSTTEEMFTYTAAVSSSTWLPSRLDRKEVTVTNEKKDQFKAFTEYGYDEQNRLTSITPSAGPAVHYGLNAYGLKDSESIITAAGEARTTRYSYNSRYQAVTQVENPLRHPTGYTYDHGRGLVKTVTDANGLTTTREYDSYGLLVKTTNADQSYTQQQLSKDQSGYFSKQEAAGSDGRTATAYFDNSGLKMREVASSLSGSVAIDYTYYPTGKLKSATVPYAFPGTPSGVTTYTYDAYGRPASTTGPGVDLAYTYKGLECTVNNGITGQHTTQAYNADGQLASVSAPTGNVSYTYFPSGLVQQIQSPRTSTSFTYDPMGNRTSVTDPDGGTVASCYNGFGELVAYKDRTMKDTAKLSYDLLGRLALQLGAERVEYSYDEAKKGTLSSVKVNGATVQTNTYDELARPKTVTEVVEGVSYPYAYSYNAAGQLEQVTYPNAFAAKYEYQSGLVKRVVSAKGGALIWEVGALSPLGQVEKATYGNGIATTNSYSGLGQLLQTTSSGSGGTVQQLAYTYASDGNLASRTDLRRSLQEFFDYDTQTGQLLGARQPATGDATTFTYLQNGLVNSRTAYGKTTRYAYREATHQVDSAFGYIPAAMGAQRLTIGEQGMVTAINAATPEPLTFTYGYDRQRRTMAYAKGGSEVLRRVYVGAYEREEQGGDTRELCYISAYGQVVAVCESKAGASAMRYVHPDHQGSFTVITDQAGSVVQEQSFTAWGQRRSPDTWKTAEAGWTAPAYSYYRGYTGHEMLDMVGLINMNARLYDPVENRFLSCDPVMQDPSNAINHNRYAYCLNNPLRYTDPTGKDYYTESFSQGGKFFYRGSYVNAGPLTTGSDRVGGGGSCGKPGEWVSGVGFNGTGRDGVYFDWKTGTKRSLDGNIVHDFDFNTVISRYAYAIKAECVYEGQATNRGDGSYVSDENGLVSVFLIITECNPVIPKATGDSGGKLFSSTVLHEEVWRSPSSFLGTVTFKSYHSRTEGSGPLNTTINQRGEISHSVNTIAGPCTVNLSSDAFTIGSPTINIKGFAFPNISSGISLQDGLTSSFEYIDRDATTHGFGISYKPSPAASVMIGVGVFLFTGIPAYY